MVSAFDLFGAGAPADARDELRAIVPRLDAAIAAGAVSTDFLAEVRLLAVDGGEQRVHSGG